jgi:hypothetical protein
MSIRMVDGWEVSFEWVIARVRLRFACMQRATPLKPFTALIQGEKIQRASYEHVYLEMEAAWLPDRTEWPPLPVIIEIAACAVSEPWPPRVKPPNRYGFKLYRYVDQRGPWLRAWWGRRRRTWVLWGGRAIPTYEGEELADLVCRIDAGERPMEIEHLFGRITPGEDIIE